MFGLEGSGFIISLAVTLLLCGVVAYYAKSQFSTMEHKITSMFELVSSLAGQVNELNKTIILSKNNNQTPGIKLSENNVDNRILVSDSEPDSDSESESTTESEPESNIHIDDVNVVNVNNHDSTEHDIINLDSHIKMGSELDQIKVVELNINDENEISGNIENLNLTKESNNHEDSSSESETEESSSESDVNSINESINESALNLESENVNDISNSDPNVENIEIFKLEDDQDDQSLSNEKNIDYKKLQVKILREMVKEKGLSTNPSKINKKDLVKFLES
jgi:hypothetical protein